MKTVKELKLRRVVKEAIPAEAYQRGFILQHNSPESTSMSFEPLNAVLDFTGCVFAGDDLVIEKKPPHARLHSAYNESRSPKQTGCMRSLAVVMRAADI